MVQQPRQNPDPKTSHCGTCGAKYLIETGVALPQQPERAADSVSRLKLALETLRYVRPDVMTEDRTHPLAVPDQGGDPRSPWSVLVEAERLILVYASGVIGAETWTELHDFLDRLDDETPDKPPDDQERCRQCRALRKYHGDADHDFER